MEIRCIVCKRGLKNLDGEHYQPLGGVAFATSGNYGSRFFDPMDGLSTTIEISVCDECLEAEARAGWVAERRCVQSPKHIFVVFNPDETCDDFASPTPSGSE